LTENFKARERGLPGLPNNVEIAHMSASLDFSDTTPGAYMEMPRTDRDAEYIAMLQAAVGGLLAYWRRYQSEAGSLTIGAAALGDDVVSGVTVRTQSGKTLFQTRLSHH
jgi:hypothetical protein